MNTTIAGLCCMALAGLGCGHVESHAVTFDRRPGAQGDVLVFAASAPPGGRPLGSVVAKGREGDDVGKLYGELVRRARDLGGNAVVVESMGARIEDKTGVYSALPSTHSRGADRAKGGGDLKPSDEVMTVELRGKVMWLGPDELARPAERGAP